MWKNILVFYVKTFHMDTNTTSILIYFSEKLALSMIFSGNFSHFYKIKKRLIVHDYYNYAIGLLSQIKSAPKPTNYRCIF